MGNSFQALGESLSAFEEFDNTHYNGVDIVYVYVGLRKIFRGSKDSINNYLPKSLECVLY